MDSTRSAKAARQWHRRPGLSFCHGSANRRSRISRSGSLKYLDDIRARSGVEPSDGTGRQTLELHLRPDSFSTGILVAILTAVMSALLVASLDRSDFCRAFAASTWVLGQGSDEVPGCVPVFDVRKRFAPSRAGPESIASVQ